MVMRLTIATAIGIALCLLSGSATLRVAAKVQKTMIASTERVDRPIEQFRSSVLGSDAKPISFAVPQWAQVRTATYSRIDSKTVNIDVEVGGEFPVGAPDRFAIQVKFPHAKGSVLAFVYCAGTYEYGSNPVIQPGEAALVRLSDFRVVSLAKVSANGKILSFSFSDQAAMDIGQPTSLVACYLPSTVDPLKIIEGFEESYVASLKFTAVGSHGGPPVGTIIPRFVAPHGRTP